MNTFTKDLESTIKILATAGRGILAADESGATIGKRFEALNIPSTEDTRHSYRELLVSTPGINEYLAGVILFEETLNQTNSKGVPFPELLKSLNIVPGIKVDKGLAAIPYSPTEQFAQGLDGLNERLASYYAQGARFAKWRSVYTLTDTLPSALCIHTNAEGLASYAALCQANGIVPMVEPEILIDHSYSIERCAEVSEAVLHAVFHALNKHKVPLELIVLKPSMVIHGKNSVKKASHDEVAHATVRILKRCVPAAVPTINFLSGGQSSEDASAHLNAMHTLYPNLPWNLSYSYARALQDYCMKAWAGKTENVEKAQKIFYTRAKLNSLASVGKYTEAMEKDSCPA